MNKFKQSIPYYKYSQLKLSFCFPLDGLLLCKYENKTDSRHFGIFHWHTAFYKYWNICILQEKMCLKFRENYFKCSFFLKGEKKINGSNMVVVPSLWFTLGNTLQQLCSPKWRVLNSSLSSVFCRSHNNKLQSTAS